jgi:hypothetical protein
MVASSATHFPPGYWPAVITSWANDYCAVAAAASATQQDKAGARASCVQELNESLAAFRQLAAERQIHVLVLGSPRDTTCSAAKMKGELVPALGPTTLYETLPTETGGHVFLGDRPNTHVYEMAGPRLGQWIANVLNG